MTSTTTGPPVAAPPPGARPPLPAGKPPVGTGLSPLFANLIALALVAAAALGVQNLLVSLDVVRGSSWLAGLVTGLDGLRGRSPVVVAVGVAAIAAGLLLLPVVVRRRPRRGLELTARTGVHLHPRDLERLAEARLRPVDAITAVRVTVRRRRIRVAATTVAGSDRRDEIVADLRARLDDLLAALARRPRVSVSVREERA